MESEIDFRIRFKEIYGIDYIEALDIVSSMKEENENNWQQTLFERKIKNTE